MSDKKYNAPDFGNGRRWESVEQELRENVAKVPTEKTLLLNEIMRNLHTIDLYADEVEELVEEGTRIPSDLMGKLAYHLGRAAESARTYAERYPRG